MGPALNSAIEKDFDFIPDGVDNFRQLIKGTSRTVQLAPTMVRNDDTRTTDVDGLPGIFDAHHSFKTELVVPLLDHFRNVAPVHRWVEHICEVIAYGGRASFYVDMSVQLRQPKRIMGKI